MSSTLLNKAEFIFTHPELGYLKPQVWEIHMRAEWGHEVKTSCFTYLERHPTLVKTKPLSKGSKYNLYGSARILDEELSDNQEVSNNKDITKAKIELIKRGIEDLLFLVDDLEIESK